MSASDEDKRLRNNGDLQVDDGVQLVIIVVDRTRRVIQFDVELVLEEARLEDHDNKDNPMQAIRTWLRARSGERDLRGERQIETIGYSVGEDFSQVPTIWC